MRISAHCQPWKSLESTSCILLVLDDPCTHPLPPYGGVSKYIKNKVVAIAPHNAIAIPPHVPSCFVLFPDLILICLFLFLSFLLSLFIHSLVLISLRYYHVPCLTYSYCPRYCPYCCYCWCCCYHLPRTQHRTILLLCVVVWWRGGEWYGIPT